MIRRREALLGLAGAITLGRVSLALAAAPTEKRLVVVVLRGALDGLSAVPAYGDRDLAAARAELVPPAPGQPGGMLDLGGFYGLNPGLAALHPMFAAGELLIVHAVAGGYRSRSHFEAQDYLELGAQTRMASGWLSRVAAAVPRTGAAAAIALGAEVPLLLRGAAPATSWLPPTPHHPEPDLYTRIAALNAGDPVTGPAILAGLQERGFSTTTLAGELPPPGRNEFPVLAAAAGRLLAAEGGPRIAAMELDGWDTHVAQARRLEQPLSALAAGLVALKDGLGEAWKQSAVLVMTEFGRTVRVNGTRGTDHGTGTIAFVLGGAVAGGRVLADWPGLATDKLLEQRDLRPTTDLRAVAKGVLAQHLGLAGPVLGGIFPDSAMAGPVRGLMRA